MATGVQMSSETMSKTVRLSDAEQEAIRKKAIEINKILINKGHAPLKDSELVHKILEKSVAYVQVDKEGGIFLECLD
jgi:hypothetical protein